MAKFAKERRRGSLPPSPGKARQSYAAPEESGPDDIRIRVLNRLRKVGLGGGPLKDMRMPDSASSTPRTRSPAKQLQATAGHATSDVLQSGSQGPMMTHLMGRRRWEEPGFKSPSRTKMAEDGNGIESVQHVRIECGAPQGLGAALSGAGQTERVSSSAPTTPKTYRMARDSADIQPVAQYPASDNPAARVMGRVPNPEHSLWSGPSPVMKLRLGEGPGAEAGDISVARDDRSYEEADEEQAEVSFQEHLGLGSEQKSGHSKEQEPGRSKSIIAQRYVHQLEVTDSGSGPHEPQTRLVQKLQAELTGAHAQISGLREELEALTDLDATRQAAMDRLVDHAASQEQAVAELQESQASWQAEVHAMRSTCGRAERLAAHICELAAMVRPIRAELGLDGMIMPDSQQLVSLPEEEVLRVFSEMLQEAEDCRAVLSNELSARDEVLQAVEAMRHKEQSLAQDLQEAGVRESQLQQVAQALQDQLRAVRSNMQKREEEIRHDAEQQVMEREVTRMMEAHTSSLQSFKEAAEAAEAAKEGQAAAEAHVRELESLLHSERQSHQEVLEELRCELSSRNLDLEEARRALTDRQELISQAERRCQRLQQELQRTRLTMEQKIGQLKGQIHSLQEEATEGVAEANRAINSEKKRATDALEALNELLPQVEGLNTNIAAERSRAASLSAALATTREMVKTLKQEASHREDQVKQMEQKARSAEIKQLELASKLSSAQHEAEAGSFDINQEMDAARTVVDKLSSRITALEEELIQRRKDSKALQLAQEEIHRLNVQGKEDRGGALPIDDSKGHGTVQHISVHAAGPLADRPSTPAAGRYSFEPKLPATGPFYRPFSQAAVQSSVVSDTEADTLMKGVAPRQAAQLKDMELSALVQQVKQLQSRMEAKRHAA